MRFQLCCWTKPLSNLINVDRENFGQEIVADINKKWTWAKNASAEHILIEDGLEHVDSTEHFLLEAERVLQTKGALEVRVPHFKNPSAYRFTHRHYFSYSLFSHFPEPHDKTKRLRVESIRLIVDKRFPLSLLDILANLFPNVWERFFYVSGLHVILRKV